MVDVLKLFSDYGWQGIVVLLVVIALFKLVTTKKWKFFKNEETDDGEYEIVEVNGVISGDIRHHTFFSHIKYAMTVEVPSLDIYASKPVRQELLRDLTYLTLKTLLEMAQELVEVESTKWSASQWNHEMQTYIGNLPVRFREKAAAANIPLEVVQKYFKWYIERLDYIREFIDHITASHVYKDNLRKSHAFLMVLHLFSITLVADAERTLRQLNGELTGKLYKNREIEACDLPHFE